MKLWVNNYAPKTLKEVIGQDAALAKLHLVINQKGVALLHGPPGTGKTSSIYALAHDLGYEVLELNASDFRDTEKIHSIIGSSLQQASLFHKGKIILVDELEGISGTEDRGGLQELNDLLETKAHALVLVANDPWDKKLATLRKKSVLIEYKNVRADSIAKLLKVICEKEGIYYLEEDLKTIGRRSGGDVRAAITDLQVACSGKNELTKIDIEQLGEREQEESIFNVLRVILKGKNPKQALDIVDEVDEDLHEIMLWLEENLALEYKGKDLAEGYNMLSKADVFFGRIRKWQYWRFLVYAKALMSAGVNVAKEQEYYGFTPYRRYGRILKIWMANQKNKKRKDITKKIAQYTHTSTREALKTIPYIKAIYAHNNSLILPFTEEEVEWLAQKI